MTIMQSIANPVKGIINEMQNAIIEEIDNHPKENVKNVETLTLSNPDKMLKALSHEFRRLLLGLIYTYEGIHPSELQKHVNAESNKIAHHLNILVEAGLVQREFSREGKSFAKYRVKNEGEKFLEFIGAKEELDKIIVNKIR